MKPLWILLGVGALVLIVGVMAVCGGLVYFGMGVVEDQVRVKLENNPEIVERLGQIEEFEIDLAASADREEEDVFVYNVRGTKGSGVVTAEHVTSSADEEEIIWAELKLPSGETVDLVPKP